MNILQVHKYYWPRDGASKYMLLLSQLLEQGGATVVPFAMQQKETLSTPYSKYFVSEIDIHDPTQHSLWNKKRIAARMIYSREARRNMEHLLREHPIDIAHLHNIYHHISPSILLALKKRKIPVVMTLHDYHLLSPNYTLFHDGAIHEEDAHGWYLSCLKHRCIKNSFGASALGVFEMIIHHKIFRWYERYVDTFISPSQWMIDVCVKHGWPRDKFVHIPHPTEFVADEWQNGEGVVYAGRLSEEKGLDVLLDAAKQTPEVPYMIVGTGPLADHLKNRIKTEEIANVACVGFKTGDELEQLLANARLHVLPSVWYENYPLAILEAKARGKLVIASSIGGIPELLPSELLIKPGDSTDLAKKVKMWYTAPSIQRQQLGAQLREETTLLNNPKTHIQAIFSEYHDLLD